MVHEQQMCEWYALCVNDSIGVVIHPVLGPVPVCDRCATKHALEVEVAA